MIRSLILAAALLIAAPATASDAKYDRTGKIAKDGKVIDLGGHIENPFPSKAACEEGIDADKVTIAVYLAQHGIDPSTVEITVECVLAGKGA